MNEKQATKKLIKEGKKVQRLVDKIHLNPRYQNKIETTEGEIIFLKSDQEISDRSFNMIYNLIDEELYQTSINCVAEKIAKQIFKGDKTVAINELIDGATEIIIISRTIGIY